MSSLDYKVTTRLPQLMKMVEKMQTRLDETKNKVKLIATTP